MDPGRAYRSRTRCRSVPQIPQCETSTRTSVAPGTGTSTARTSMTPSPTYTAAGMSRGTAAGGTRGTRRTYLRRRALAQVRDDKEAAVDAHRLEVDGDRHERVVRPLHTR